MASQDVGARLRLRSMHSRITHHDMEAVSSCSKDRESLHGMQAHHTHSGCMSAPALKLEGTVLFVANQRKESTHIFLSSEDERAASPNQAHQRRILNAGTSASSMHAYTAKQF